MSFGDGAGHGCGCVFGVILAIRIGNLRRIRVVTVGATI
jgi:hypothetical protein